MPSPAPPKAIIFDLLTALLDSWTAWDKAATAAAAASALPANTAAQNDPGQSPGRTWRAHYLSLTYACGPYRPYEDLVHESAVLAGLPPGAPAALLGGWDAALRPWPEARSVLDALRARGFELGVVTNCSAELGHRAAALCGVRFDSVVTAEEAGFYKPAKQAYEEVLSRLGVRAEEALFVAGSSADVPGAASVGMRVVWHNRVGLESKGGVKPEKEGATLEEALNEFL